VIVNGVRVSREALAGDPLNLGRLFKKGLKGLGKLALGAGKAYLGVPGAGIGSGDAYTKRLDKVGTERRPAQIIIGGTRVTPRTDPLGIGRQLGLRPLGGGGGRRYRRMRVTNVRALRRAFRRVEGFGRLARRYVRVQHRFKPAAFRRRRRK